MKEKEEAIECINNFLKKHHWCDFEVIKMKGDLIIGGKTGFSDYYDIEIIFEDIFFLQILYEWKTNTSVNSFFIANIEENNFYNYNYSIEEEHILFKIIAEDIAKPLYISAKNIIVNKVMEKVN